MKLAIHSLVLLSASVAVCRADDPLDGFRKAPLSVKSTIQAPNLMEQARRALVAGANESPDVLRELLDVKNESGSFLHYVFGGQASKDFLSALENARTDKQSGGTPGTGGGTSLVSKPGVSSVLSAAVESGALTQSTSSGMQTTLRGNAVGITRMLLGDDVFNFCNNVDPKTHEQAKTCDQGIVRFLKPLSVSVTLGPNGQSPVTVPVSGSATQTTPASAATPAASSTPSSVVLPNTAQKVSAWGARYAIRNPHALDSQKNRQAYFDGLGKAGDLLSNTTKDIFLPIASYTAWRESAITNLTNPGASASQTAFEAAFSKELDRLVQILRAANNDFDTQGIAAWSAYQSYFNARETALDALNDANLLTLEYTHSDEANQPSLSNLRFIYSRQQTKAVLLTANIAGEWYNTLPQNATVSRFRDFQASAEVDVSLKQWGQLGTPVYSAAGYFQYQQDPALINITNANLAPGTNIALPGGAATVLGQKGNIGIGQVKLTIPFKNTGVSFPIAVTWSNRTELIKASDVSGHVGIAFDLDSLFTQKKSQ